MQKTSVSINSEVRQQNKMFCFAEQLNQLSILKHFFCFTSDNQIPLGKLMFFLHTLYLENKAKSSKKKTGHCLIHPNKGIWSCFGNVLFYKKICNSLFPLNPSIVGLNL